MRADSSECSKLSFSVAKIMQFWFLGIHSRGWTPLTPNPREHLFLTRKQRENSLVTNDNKSFLDCCLRCNREVWMEFFSRDTKTRGG